ncbi:MAG: ABC transporter substrate-binding protein [Alphaproteobacteria bacterium]|nr:ABC transporter substrate-binding protein [Alphaproteobacteria bacterium]
MDRLTLLRTHRLGARRWNAATIAVAFAVLAALLFSPTAHAGQTPADYVQHKVNEGVGILSDKSLAGTARTDKFRAFILNLVDERNIALFTLGNYRRGADDALLNEFVQTFTEYSVAVYEARLGEYSGQTLRVTDTLERTPTDIVVTTILDDKGQSGEPINVAFRLSKKGADFTVVDIQVVGIWLAIDQRSQFTSFLGQNGGDISKLIADLKKRTADVRAGIAEK